MNWAIELSKTYIPSTGQANLYGVIVYTDAHVYVKKVLQDKDFWQALHEISGPQWIVFATKTAEGHWDYPKLPPDTLGVLVRVWKEPNANKELLAAFELESTKSLPVIVVFAQNQEGQIFKNILKIDDSSEEAAFKSIKAILISVAEALEEVDEENLRSGANAYNAVSYSLKSYKEWQMLKKGIAIWQWFRSLM